MATLGVDKYARKGGRGTKGLPCRYASMQLYLRLPFNFGVNSLPLLSRHIAQGWVAEGGTRSAFVCVVWLERRGVIVISESSIRGCV